MKWQVYRSRWQLGMSRQWPRFQAEAMPRVPTFRTSVVVQVVRSQMRDLAPSQLKVRYNKLPLALNANGIQFHVKQPRVSGFGGQVHQVSPRFADAVSFHTGMALEHRSPLVSVAPQSVRVTSCSTVRRRVQNLSFQVVKSASESLGQQAVEERVDGATQVH